MTDAQLALILRSAADILASPGATSVRFVLTTYRYKETGLMANPSIPFNLADLQIATIPLVWSGGQGLPITGGTATCDHPDLATVAVFPGDTGVDVTAITEGTIVITYTPSDPKVPAAMCTVDLVAEVPVPATAVSLDTANITFRPANAPAVITTS